MKTGSMDDIRDIWTNSVQHYHDLWVLYVAVVGGLLAFASSAIYTRTSKELKCILSAAFVGFAISSVKSLLDSSALQSEALTLLEAEWNNPARSGMLAAMKATEPWKIYLLHTLAALWAAALPFRKQDR
jgi:hypothetical protein